MQRNLSRILLAFLLIFLIACIIPIAHSSDEVLIDSWTSTGLSRKLQTLHPSTSTALSAKGQTFKTLDDGNHYKITIACFYLAKIGSPLGYATARLYKVTGTPGSSGKPTGQELATSDPFDVSQLTGSWKWYNLTFSGSEQYTMEINHDYCIAFVNPTSGTISASDYPQVGHQAGDADANNFEYSSNSWNVPSSSWDTPFKVYGVVAAPTKSWYDITTFAFNSQGRTWLAITTLPFDVVGRLTQTITSFHTSISIISVGNTNLTYIGIMFGFLALAAFAYATLGVRGRHEEEEEGEEW